MYELWAKERQQINYRYITEFKDEFMWETMVDTLSKEKFKEAMILDRSTGQMEHYVEIKRPTQKVLTKTIPHSRS